LNRREAHRVVARQLEDAHVGSDCAAHDVAPRVVGERAEHAVEVGRRNLHCKPSTTVWLYQAACQALPWSPSGCALLCCEVLENLVSRRVSIAPGPVRRFSESNGRAPQTVMTILPWACPCPRYWRASGTSARV